MEYIKGDIVGEQTLVTEAEVITALRIDVYDNDEITRLIKAAQEATEDYCNIDFLKKEYSIFTDDIPTTFTCEKTPLVSIEEVKAYQNSGNSVDITSDFVKTTRDRIRRVITTAVSDLRDYDTYEFKVIVGHNEMTEKVKQAVIWHCYNNFYKVNVDEWMPAFKSLLFDIRRRNA